VNGEEVDVEAPWSLRLVVEEEGCGDGVAGFGELFRERPLVEPGVCGDEGLGMY
jgi:hypothetical protein